MNKYEINLFGSGGEIGIGKISKKAYEYWKEADEGDLYNVLNELDDEDDLPDGVSLGWTAGDADILQSYGSCGFVQISQNDDQYQNIGLSRDELAEAGLKVNWTYSRQRDYPDGYYAYYYFVEKGSFGTLEIELDDEFDVSKLKLSGDFIMTDELQECLINGISYDGWNPDDGEFELGGDGRGVASYCGVFVVGNPK
tara:strand:+ start:2073 stop:2663 length:591 start_codon:yes stop_codon:yes gene_type:complete